MITQEVIDNNIKHLRSSKEEFFWFYTEMSNGGNGIVFPLDLLATWIVHRSLLIISAFTDLIEKKNFISAASLVRLHLDTLLQFYAAFIVRDPHKYALDKIKWKHTNDLKDRNGKQMTDWYLVQRFLEDGNNKEFGSLRYVYKETSGFIHLSDKHIFSAQTKHEWNNISFCISDRMEHISLDKENEAILVMIEITKWIFKYLIWWIHSKNNPKTK